MAGLLSAAGNKVFDWIPPFLKLGGYRASAYIQRRRYEQSGGPMAISWDGSMVSIADHDHSLLLPSFRRIPRYRRGITHRIDRLADRYGCPAHFEPKAGDIVVDVGANIGEFTIFAAKRGARVVAFEPDPWVFECLTENLGKTSKTECLPLALWNERTTLHVFSAADKADSSLIEPDSPVRHVVDTEAWPLDEVPQIAGLHRIDFLKIDGEGAEPEILEGAAAALARTRNIAIDVGPERHGESTKDQVATLLNAAGFRVLDHYTPDVLLAENSAVEEL